MTEYTYQTHGILKKWAPFGGQNWSLFKSGAPLRIPLKRHCSYLKSVQNNTVPLLILALAEWQDKSYGAHGLQCSLE